MVEKVKMSAGSQRVMSASIYLSLIQSLKIIDEYSARQTIKPRMSFHVQLSIIMILTLTIFSLEMKYQDQMSFLGS